MLDLLQVREFDCDSGREAALSSDMLLGRAVETETEFVQKLAVFIYFRQRG